MWADINARFRYAKTVALAAMVFCLAALVAAAFLFFSSDGKAEEASKAVGGDNFVNNGNNFGHMGNVYIGRQQFNFTPEVAKELAQKLPRQHPIEITIVGSPRSFAAGAQIVDFLRKSGFEIGVVNYYGELTPVPPGPLSFDGKTLTIDADI